MNEYLSNNEDNNKIIKNKFGNKENMKFDIESLCYDYMDKEFTICCSGNALSKIFKINSYTGLILENISECEKLDRKLNFEEYKLYCQLIPDLIIKKGKIFYRMSADNKVKLINFLKKDKKSVIAMCGDGANDCGALLSADIGIALNDNESTKRITSHFSYKLDSIICIEIILRNGRACFENNIMIFKYIILYACLQTSITIILDSYDKELTDCQLFFQDLFISLIFCILAAK